MPRRRFQRPQGERRYRKIYFIATEGIKTEPQYFSIFNNQQSVIRVSCLKGKHDSSPAQVLRRMEIHLKNSGLELSDEAWLVVDKDNWSEEQLMQLYRWSQEAENYGLALSNPKFEYWLLLHFEDGVGITSSHDCSARLKGYLPGYDKGVDPRKYTREMINSAIIRARQRDNPPCEDWPRDIGGTTVYKLIENILQVK